MLTSQDYSPSSVVYIPEPISSIYLYLASIETQSVVITLSHYRRLNKRDVTSMLVLLTYTVFSHISTAGVSFFNRLLFKGHSTLGQRSQYINVRVLLKVARPYMYDVFDSFWLNHQKVYPSIGTKSTVGTALTAPLF